MFEKVFYSLGLKKIKSIDDILGQKEKRKIISEISHATKRRDMSISEINHFFSGPLEISKPWLKNNTIYKEFIQHEVARVHNEFLEEQSHWQEVTDCTRLTAIFERLNGEKIVALENCGINVKDGTQICMDEFDDRRELGEFPTGHDKVDYVFYHSQDLDRVIESGNLVITYGSHNYNTTEINFTRQVKVATRVIELLEESGFEVSWNKDEDHRIFVKNFSWQRRIPFTSH